MANRLTPRQQAARLRKRHPDRGMFVKQTGNGNSKRSPQYSTPVGVTTSLSRMLRPQAAFRWILPNRAAITPQYVEMVMRGALAGNHVQQWELFEFMFDSWPTLSSCFQELINGVLSKKLIFEPYQEEDEPPSDSALEKHKLVSTALKQMQPDPYRDENDLPGTLEDILDGWFRGIVVLETLWTDVEDETLGLIKAPQSTFWVHPVAYGFNADGVLGLRTVGNVKPNGTVGNAQNTPPISSYPFSYLSAQPQPSVLEPFPDYKFLIGIHKVKPGTALAGPLLRSLAWWWVASGYCEDWLLNLAQLYGLPFRFATYDPNAPDETIQAIQNMLQNMGSAGWAAFPQGTEIEFKETGGGRMAEYSPQGTMLDRADRYVREVVLGQTMTGNTMTSGKGGQAFGVVEKDVKQERIDAAGKYACEVINAQLIKSILMLNYGEDSEAPRVRLLEENEGQFVDAQRDQILLKMGVKFGVDFISKKYGIPEPAADEEVLEQQQLQPFGGFGNEPTPDGEPQQMNEMQPGMEQGDQAMQSASGAYAPGHPFYGNQWTRGQGAELGMGNTEKLHTEKGVYSVHALAGQYRGKYAANLMRHDGTTHHLGIFKSVKEARTAAEAHAKSEHFPSLRQSAEDERRQLQNIGIQTKAADEPQPQPTPPPPQVINVTVEAAKVIPTTKSFTINRADGTVITGEIAAKEDEKPNE